MLQQERAEDYVIATRMQFSVRDFVSMAAACLDIHLHSSDSYVSDTLRANLPSFRVG